jgi:hypothetical protein
VVDAASSRAVDDARLSRALVRACVNGRRYRCRQRFLFLHHYRASKRLSPP